METWRRLDDPPESAFTDAITGVGGDCLVHPGPSYEAIFALKLLFRAFGRFPSESTVVGTALAGAHALLLLADAVAKSLGHTRSTLLPLDPPEAAVDGRALKKTVRGLTFATDRLEEILRPRGLPIRFLEPFVCDVEPVVPSGRWDDHPLLTRPLVRAGRSLVLATPGTVGSACIGHVFSSAQHHATDLEMLTTAFLRASEEHLGRLLHLMGWQVLPTPHTLDDDDIPSVSNVLCCFDTDKFAHVQLLVDFGANIDCATTHWEIDDEQSARIAAQQSRADNYLRQEHAIPAEQRLRLIITSGFGRGAAVPGRRSKADRVLRFSLEALDTLVLQRDTDPLTLWKFADALNDLRRTARVSAWSDLDVYAVYCAHGRSFYLSDDKRPTHVGIDASMSRELRENVRRRNDIHGVDMPSGEITLATLFWGPGVPVYVNEASLFGAPPKFLVEHDRDTSTWVYLAASEAPAPLCRELLETVAYWCWQLSPVIIEKGWTIAPIRLTVRGTEREWDDALKVQLARAEEANGVVIGQESRELQIEIRPAFAANAARADNQAERGLLRCLLCAVRQGGRTLMPSELEALVDRVAPLGKKKKFLALAQGAGPALWDGDLGHRRTLQDHDVSRALDGVGERLAHRLSVSLPWDPISTDRYKEVFELLRQDFLDRIMAHLAPLDGHELLQALVRNNENITQARAFQAMSTAPSLACFEGFERAGEIVREAERLDRSALCTRIAVEIVAARRPAGTSRPSTGDIDQLLGLVDGYCGACVLAEETRCRVYPHALSFLASGRLGVEPQPKSLAKRFWPAKRQEGIQIAVDTFERHWETPDQDRRDPVKAAEFEEAFAAEFEVRLGVVQDVINGMFAIAVDQESSCCTMNEADLIKSLHSRGAGTAGEIQKVLDIFALDERDSWATLPSQFTFADIDPARYKRRLSFIARPLLRSRGREITWGPRHLLQSLTHLLGMLILGRVPHANLKSKQMLEYCGAARHEIGKKFEARVFEDLHGSTSFALYRRIGIGPGEYFQHDVELGDFDVLACDPVNAVIYLLECKATDFGRSPGEISQEADSLLRGDLRKSGPSRVEAHLRRVSWLKENWHVVGDRLSLRPGGWRIVPVMVTSSLLPSPYLVDSPVPFRSLAELMAGQQPWNDLLKGPWVDEMRV